MTAPNIRIFEVGGAVRDKFLGLSNKDRDFAVEAPSWEAMRAHVHGIASKVFLETPEHFTIRALVPTGELDGKGKPKFDARDFVLCRKDGPHSDGRHPDWVEAGTILDDLARRDFTVNAMAIDMQTGELLDPHGGRVDLEAKVLRCVGSAEARFGEDALRIVRALRFSLTKGLTIDEEIRTILTADGTRWAEHLRAVSVERIREELLRCFKHNTPATLRLLAGVNPAFINVMLGGQLWLEPTLSDR
jgi:tRNA nucleotidyltransferase/poly(A) polymerase